jgi:hypothetical protein
MTKQNITNLYNTLVAFGEVKDTGFAYCVLRNLKKLSPEMGKIEEFLKATNYADYEKERIQILEKHSAKIKGEPVIVSGKYDIKNKDKFNKDITKLQEKYKNLIQQVEEEFKKEVEVDLHKIKLEKIPQDLTPKQLESIIEIIEE